MTFVVKDSVSKENFLAICSLTTLLCQMKHASGNNPVEFHKLIYSTHMPYATMMGMENRVIQNFRERETEVIRSLWAQFYNCLNYPSTPGQFWSAKRQLEQWIYSHRMKGVLPTLEVEQLFSDTAVVLTEKAREFYPPNALVMNTASYKECATKLLLLHRQFFKLVKLGGDPLFQKKVEKDIARLLAYVPGRVLIGRILRRAAESGAYTIIIEPGAKNTASLMLYGNKFEIIIRLNCVPETNVHELPTTFQSFEWTSETRLAHELIHGLHWLYYNPRKKYVFPCVQKRIYTTSEEYRTIQGDPRERDQATGICERHFWAVWGAPPRYGHINGISKDGNPEVDLSYALIHGIYGDLSRIFSKMTDDQLNTLYYNLNKVYFSKSLELLQAFSKEKDIQFSIEMLEDLQENVYLQHEGGPCVKTLNRIISLNLTFNDAATIFFIYLTLEKTQRLLGLVRQFMGWRSYNYEFYR